MKLSAPDDPFYRYEPRPLPSFELPPPQVVFGGTPDPGWAEKGGGGNVGEGDEDPTKEDQRDDHPFAISVQTVEQGLGGEPIQWNIKVLGGKYATGDGTPIAVEGGDYPTVVLSENQHKSPGGGELPVKPVALLFVPIELCTSTDTGAVRMSDGRYARAIEGGEVYLSKTVPAAFPVPIKNPITNSPGFFVHLGTWTSRYAEQDTGGVPTREGRNVVSQNVREDVVLTSDSAGEPATGAHPFQVRLSDSSPSAPKARISASSRLYTALASTTTAISGIGDEIALGSSTKVWLKGTVNSSLVVTAASITATDPAGLITTTGSPASQTEFHLLIGKVTSGASDAPGFGFRIGTSDYHFEQTCFTHLLVEARCNNGVPIVYPFAFTGA